MKAESERLLGFNGDGNIGIYHLFEQVTLMLSLQVTQPYVST